MTNFIVFTHSKTRTKRVKAFLTRLGFKNIGYSELVYASNTAPLSKQEARNIVRAVWISLSGKEFQECWYSVETYGTLMIAQSDRQENQKQCYEFKSIEDLITKLVYEALS